MGQYIIPLISDPFGYGWDLFGTKLYFINIGIINARWVWIISVIAIVVGHIFAVFLAHVMGQRVVRDPQLVYVARAPPADIDGRLYHGQLMDISPANRGVSEQGLVGFGIRHLALVRRFLLGRRMDTSIFAHSARMSRVMSPCARARL